MNERSHEDETVQVGRSLLMSQHDILVDLAADLAKLQHHIGGYGTDPNATESTNRILKDLTSTIGGLMLDIEALTGGEG